MQQTAELRAVIITWCILLAVMLLVFFAGRRVREVSERQRMLLAASINQPDSQANSSATAARPLSPEERRRRRMLGGASSPQTAPAGIPAVTPSGTTVSTSPSGPPGGTTAMMPVPVEAPTQPGGTGQTAIPSTTINRRPEPSEKTWGEACAERMSGLIGLSQGGELGNLSSPEWNEWNSFWDIERVQRLQDEGVVSPVERFFGRMDMRKKTSAALPGQSVPAESVPLPVDIKPVIKQEIRFARAIGQAGDSLYLHLAYEVRLLPLQSVGEIFLHTGEIGLGLPLFLPATGEQVLKLENSTTYLFIITPKTLHRVHRKTGRSGRLPLPEGLIPESGYVFRYAYGSLHFVTPERVIRYNLKERKWRHYPLEYHFKPLGGIRIMDVAVEMRKDYLYYWISTATRGLVVVDDKGRNLRGPGGELEGIISELPAGKKKIALSKQPVRPMQRIGDNLLFALNSPVDSTEEASLYRLDQLKGRFFQIPAVAPGVYEYNQILHDSKRIIFLHDAGWQAIDRAKLMADDRVILAGGNLTDLMGGCLTGDTLRLINYSGVVYSLSLRGEGREDMDDDNTEPTETPGR